MTPRQISRQPKSGSRWEFPEHRIHLPAQVRQLVGPGRPDRPLRTGHRNVLLGRQGEPSKDSNPANRQQKLGRDLE